MQNLNMLVAGATVLELALREAVTVDGGRLRVAALGHLVERGSLRHDTRRVLGLFTVTRHPTVDRARAVELRERITRVLTHPDPVSDPRDAALGGLVRPAGGGVLRRLAPGDQRRAASQRAKELSKGEGMSADVAKAIGDANAAALVAVTAAASGRPPAPRARRSPVGAHPTCAISRP